MYKCRDCPFSTNWLYNLRKHEKFMHNPSEMYECRDCPYSTNYTSNLRKHQKSMHNPNDLRKHEKAMHNPSVTEYHCTINVTALENSMMNELNEYQKKLELGREIKEIALKRDIPTACLSKEKMDALELFENHVQVKYDEWRPWL